MVLHCDRKLVHAMLKEWFPCKDIAFTDSTTTTTTLHLQKFDDLVRRQVCLAVSQGKSKVTEEPTEGQTLVNQEPTGDINIDL